MKKISLKPRCTIANLSAFLGGLALGLLVLVVFLLSQNSLREGQTSLLREDQVYTRSQIEFMRQPVAPYSMIKNRDGSYRVFHTSGEYNLQPNIQKVGNADLFPNPQGGGKELFPNPQGGGFDLFPNPQGN